MNDRIHRSIVILRLVLGLVVLVQSVQSILGLGKEPHESLIRHVLPVLAGVETLGALLIVVPRTVRLGAQVLIAVFLIAIAIHGLHGNWNVGSLVIYAASAAVILASSPPTRARTAAA